MISVMQAIYSREYSRNPMGGSLKKNHLKYSIEFSEPWLT